MFTGLPILTILNSCNLRSRNSVYIFDNLFIYKCTNISKHDSYLKALGKVAWVSLQILFFDQSFEVAADLKWLSKRPPERPLIFMWYSLYEPKTSNISELRSYSILFKAKPMVSVDLSAIQEIYSHQSPNSNLDYLLYLIRQK